MTKFDKQYLELVKKILKEGEEVENRTGINTLKISGHYFEFDLQKEFPILQTKYVFWRGAITEMLWIWQMQSNDVRELQNRGIEIWNEWMIDEDGIYRIYEPKLPNQEYEYEPDKEVVVMDPLSVPISDPYGKRYPMQPKYDENGKIMTAKSKIPGKTIKTAKYYGKEHAFTIAKGYGYLNRLYEFTQDLIYTIKNHPNDRRMVYSFYQNAFIRDMVLPPCVYETKWTVTNGKLNVIVDQRSCDTAAGLPFNVTQYATLLMMIAQVTGLEPGIMRHIISDAHIYVNHIDGMEKQLGRWNQYEFYQDTTKFFLNNTAHRIEKQLKNPKLDPKIREGLIEEQKIVDLVLNPSKPELWLNPEINDFFQFDNSSALKDIKVKKYKHLGKIPFDIAQ